ncbi:Protein-tyrosine phosphatase [Onchocerca flexuosa]|uniref:Protein-tyrosine phosphatase n=1 Tax=Onchocerca flexuosa TaxID=387005 RepID=A0A238BNZ7_9BILA|nr:Protein-tyrosine phosphatase [Onchocerca flexuosa]
MSGRSMNDGLFGECASTERRALIVSNPAEYILKKVLSTQLEQLGRKGYTLEDARTQCLIAYFKVVLMLQLKYDLNFCNVVNPENIWRVLQSIKLAFVNDVTTIQSVNSDRELLDNFIKQQQQQQQIDSTGDVNSDDVNSNAKDFNSIPERNMWGNNNILDSTEWDGEEKSINNDGDMLTVETFMPSATPNSGEEEEEEEDSMMNSVVYHAPVLKKDIEHLGNQNTGLEKIEHKIVKGMPSYQKVDGNRVYLKIAKDLDDGKLRNLINYLDFSIAKPNQLIFDEFLLDGDQLSFRAGRSALTLPQNENLLDSVGDKRRKDIQAFSGVHVDETGIGSGEEAVPVESEARDRFFMPIIGISIFTLSLLVTIMAIHQAREHCKKLHKSNITEFNSQKVEEPVGQSSLDISTGHVILSFLRDYLNDTSKIEEQWKTLNEYANPHGISSIAREEENIAKNRNPSCLPYDDTLVKIRDVVNDSAFINASAIHDCDPKQANYIATQSPLPETVADFWQMIWEQVAVLIVNLADNVDLQEGRCLKYWPESGSQIYGSFEIHLVSEHIWSEDYLVRSFYLKNLKTNETRTVTQFHFLTWPKKGVPPNTKAVLDFRRKINKSYRGRAVPIVVHCTDGTGRTGTFCLLDMILNRVTRGVKELNVAGSLEHLRDQRPGMVETCEQYKMYAIIALITRYSYSSSRTND